MNIGSIGSTNYNSTGSTNYNSIGSTNSNKNDRVPSKTANNHTKQIEQLNNKSKDDMTEGALEQLDDNFITICKKMFIDVVANCAISITDCSIKMRDAFFKNSN